MSKPKVAFYWCASCGGCEEAVVDLHEDILGVVEAVDIVFWPVALDFKIHHVEAMVDQEIAVSFINGAVRTEEQEHMAKLLRQKSQLVVAFGACAVSGGIPALANLTTRKAILSASYHTAPTVVNPEGTEPRTSCEVAGVERRLPGFYERVYKLDDVIEVDYYLPGCAPPTKLVLGAVQAILAGELPERGAVLAPNKALCASCTRNDSKPDDVCVDQLRRPVDVELDPERCFLLQGVLCMGPATRDGCDVVCVEGNMPCTGCMGPLDSAGDQGTGMIGTLGGIVAGDTPEEFEANTRELVDPAGTLYRYTLSAFPLQLTPKEND